jgi:hypothetical protein
MSLASSVWAALALSASLPPLPPRRPQFSVSLQLVPLAGSRGAYALPVHDPSNPQNFRRASAEKEFLRKGFERAEPNITAVLIGAIRT